MGEDEADESAKGRRSGALVGAGVRSIRRWLGG